ncbi:MAG: hypothetical protein KDK99_01810 [Verrucomicrobiales bacterium]|nr:hypothetical protein [Verrucomicrobiales bacterium]
MPDRTALLGITSATAGNSALITFALYLVGVFVLAALANRLQNKAEFASEYFLGSKNIGMWAFALTYAATAASGGSFMGFPALIYSHGWSLAWWIAGYSIVPIVSLGLFAKRINQVGRIAGAITVPELLRRRFASPAVGNVATALVVFFMFFYLLAQFKAGAEIMATLLEDVAPYQTAVHALESITRGLPWIGQSSGDYLLCLLVFAITVILYTAYGGFRAVVWTDVMQGLIMAVGVILLLSLTLRQVGGLHQATQTLAAMTPPEFGTARLQRDDPDPEALTLPRGSWIKDAAAQPLRLQTAVTLAAGERLSAPTSVLRITTEEEKARLAPQVDPRVTAIEINTTAYAHGAGKPGVYLHAPGPSRTTPTGFLSVFLALSFFAFWNFSGAGQPSYMVRQMAYNNTVTLRRSIILVAVFFTLIYFPLVIIFTSARIVLPGMEIHPDRIMPEMASHITQLAGMPWLAGLLIAAPFAAVMSSVDSFLILVSSGVVRDIYQENINPQASEKTVKRLSHLVTVGVGLLAVFAVLNPPRFLQDLIVFASGGLGASFLMPMVFALYWPRMTAGAAVGGMISGALTILVLYCIGYAIQGEFGEYNLLGLHPFVWSILVTTVVILLSSRFSQAPEQRLIEKFFGR